MGLLTQDKYGIFINNGIYFVQDNVKSVRKKFKRIYTSDLFSKCEAMAESMNQGLTLELAEKEWLDWAWR